MFRLFAAVAAAALVPSAGSEAFAQAAPATPRVGSPNAIDRSEPLPAPPFVARRLSSREEPLPASLTLSQALEEAEARSPTLVAAQAAVDAAKARVDQAGFRSNPELSVEVENFAGSGELSGFQQTETTVALNQRLDLGGRRQARIAAAKAELASQQLRLSIARADLAQQVRQQFAQGVTARERHRLAQANAERARELARVAAILVDAGREPPLRALRARSAAAQAAAELEAARAEERASLATLSALFGATSPLQALNGDLLELKPKTIDPEQSLEVRLAAAELFAAEAALAQEQAARRLDPAVGLGVRHFRESGDVGLVGGFSMPLPVFDRNRGNISAARSNVLAAEARRAGALASITVRARNAIANVEAAEGRVEALEKAAIPEAAEALRLAQISYREGKASLLELLDVQTSYTTAQAALIDARLALALATAELGRVAAR